MKSLRIPLAIVLVVLAGRTFHANAQTVTVLYSFGSSPNDGGDPVAGLVQASDGNFYGTTEYGGANNDGTVFRISPDGSYSNLYSFAGATADGATPAAGLVQGSDGNLYGTTYYGGDNNHGTIFRISLSGTETNLHSFAPGTPDGYCPMAGLVLGRDGNFYGTTRYGGINNTWGTVFRISPSSTLTTLYSFGSSPNDGANPQAGLTQGSDSNFYGITDYGGANNYGSVFRISPGGTYTNLYSFGVSSPSGYSPPGGLVQGFDGNFYGATQEGGTYAVGTVFRISPSGTYTDIYSFYGMNSDGANPVAGLVQGSDGNLYGTTFYGGTSYNCGSSGCGSLFRISLSGNETVLHSFGSSADDATSPRATLVQGSDGNFYGTTTQGGTSGNGTVFRLDVGLGPVSTNCLYSINPTNAVFGATGGAATVSVIASNGCAWTATNSSPFITITSGANGTGSGTVSYTVAANTSTNDLTGTISIADQTFTVTESGTTSSGGCTFSVGTKTSIILTAKGGSKSVRVKTKGTDCAWTAVSNDPFITITSGSGGTGSGKVVYRVPGNTNTTPLSGTMTIASQTFTVNQAAGGCTYKLSPKAGKLKADGGTANIKVNPNLGDCDWTAVRNDGFITITGGASGTGKGTVTYTVPANATSNVLTGSIAVAGQTFTVIQAGVKAR